METIHSIVLVTFWFTLIYIHSQLKKVRMNTQEAVDKLMAMNSQVKKSIGEISGKFDDLNEAINNAGEVPPAVAAAINELGVSIQTADDLVPDAAPAEQPGDATGTGDGEVTDSGSDEQQEQVQ